MSSFVVTVPVWQLLKWTFHPQSKALFNALYQSPQGVSASEGFKFLHNGFYEFPLRLECFALHKLLTATLQTRRESESQQTLRFRNVIINWCDKRFQVSPSLKFKIAITILRSISFLTMSLHLTMPEGKIRFFISFDASSMLSWRVKNWTECRVRGSMIWNLRFVLLFIAD